MGEVPMYATETGAVIGSPSGLWTCVGSSDGVNGAMDGVDRWTSSFDPSLFVNAGAGSPHSWIVLYAPASMTPRPYLIIDYLTNHYQMTVRMCFATPTGGDNSNRPTATDEIAVSAWSNMQFSDVTTGQQVHGSLSEDGYFTFFTTSSGSALGKFAMFFQKLADTRTGDGYPVAMYAKYDATNGAMTRTNMLAAANWAGKKHDGSADMAGLGVLQPTLTSIAGSIFGTMSLHDRSDMLFDDFPVYLFNSTAGYYTNKGRLYDIRFAPEGLFTGYVEPNTSNPASAVVGHFWVPTYVAPIS